MQAAPPAHVTAHIPIRLSNEEANALVVENQGWGESIARSVARAWNLDWQMDGLDGAVMEALIFCSRRFDTSRGIPFKGYARKRIHEAACDAARKTKGWLKKNDNSTAVAQQISQELIDVFPNLRVGDIAESGSTDSDEMRGAIRGLLLGASLLAAKHDFEDGTSAEEVLDHKRLVETLSSLEPVHQAILWKIYWEGDSMRTVASEWELDELTVIREHKVLVAHLSKCLAVNRKLEPPRIRPALKPVALRLKKDSTKGTFSALLAKVA